MHVLIGIQGSSVYRKMMVHGINMNLLLSHKKGSFPKMSQLNTKDSVMYIDIYKHAYVFFRFSHVSGIAYVLASMCVYVYVCTCM